MYQWRSRAETVFDNRRSAGRDLAAALLKRGSKFTAVLGLTRGGVPLAYEVASALRVPMDVLVIKKLPTPDNPELAIGAVSADGAKVLHEHIIRQLGVSEAYLAKEIELRMAKAKEEEVRYRGNNPPLDIRAGSPVIVDDGIATGSSVEAAILSVRKKGAASVTIATPVASGESCSSLRKLANDILCLTTPADFWAVGMFYRDFSQVTDEEVRDLLNRSRAELKRGPNAPT